MMIGKEAFYHLQKDRELQCAFLAHVDDFTIAQTEDFADKILDTVSN